MVPQMHEVDDFVDVSGFLQHVAAAEPPLFEVQQTVVVGGVGEIFAHQVVGTEVKASAGHLGALLQFQRARCGIARVGERRFPDLFALAVQRLEAGEGHQDFAAHLEKVGVIVALQAQWYRGDGAHVGRHIVALRAVAARHRPFHHAVFVLYADGETVVFQLANVFNISVEEGADAVVELQQLLFRVGVAERKHRIDVLHGLEAFRHGAAHPLRGTVGLHELGMRLLQLLQMAQQLVELVVADDRRVQHVVVVVVAVKLCGESDNFFFYWIHECGFFGCKFTIIFSFIR